MRNPFRYFNSSPEVIRLKVMMYIRYPLSLRQVEDILFERGIDLSRDTVRYWWRPWPKTIADRWYREPEHEYPQAQPWAEPLSGRTRW